MAFKKYKQIIIIKKIRQISLTENDYAGTPKPILIVHLNKLPPVVTRQIVAPGNMTPHE